MPVPFPAPLALHFRQLINSFLFKVHALSLERGERPGLQPFRKGAEHGIGCEEPGPGLCSAPSNVAAVSKQEGSQLSWNFFSCWSSCKFLLWVNHLLSFGSQNCCSATKSSPFVWESDLGQAERMEGKCTRYWGIQTGVVTSSISGYILSLKCCRLLETGLTELETRDLQGEPSCSSSWFLWAGASAWFWKQSFHCANTSLNLRCRLRLELIEDRCLIIITGSSALNLPLCLLRALTSVALRVCSVIYLLCCFLKQKLPEWKGSILPFFKSLS